jgi:ferredoxin/coenzyme F420-reducing hydrogenase delta subunit
MNGLKRGVRAVFARLENLLDRLCTPAFNPLGQLGALGWFLFWLIAISGIYLYIFFDTGVTQAYTSIESITQDQWWAGGIMRSFHRYASDGLVVVAFLHMLREFGLDRLRGRRWFAWITGLLLIGFIYVCGITGYWMVWDQLAQYVALTTSAWLDALPIFAEPISRNFLNNASLSGRFFTLMVYVHIAAPLLMLLFMWIHIQRYNYARVNPPRRMMVVAVAAFVALSLLDPALSQAPANLDALAVSVRLDWFYVALYPLTETVGAPALWWGVILAFVILTALPWLPPQRESPPAEVHLDNCNGCGRCFADCPFGAITMQPRSDGAAFSEEAVVEADLCVRCGICVGACPTATPFRRATALIPGIEMPAFNLASLRNQIETLGRDLTGDARVLMFRCPNGAAVATSPGVAIVEVPCVGMVPPPFLDLIVRRRLADGVLLAGCGESECYERLGIDWTEQRIAARRDPYLRDNVPRERVAVSWAGSGQVAMRANTLAQFSAALIAGAAKSGPSASSAAWRDTASRLPRPVRYAGLGVIVAASGLLLGFLSDTPAVQLRGADEAVVTLSFSHAGELKEKCRVLTPEEMARLEPNMRRPSDCTRARWPVYVELELDGHTVYAARHAPAGLWDDGPSSLFARFRVPAGAQRAEVRLRDTGRESGFDASSTAELDLQPGQNLVIEFRQPGGFSFR